MTFDEATTPSRTESPQKSSPNGVAHTDSAPAGSKENAFADRKRIFSDNRLPVRKPKNIFQLAWMAYNDKVLILLTCAAVISLALGLYQTFGVEHEPGEPAVEWIEGVAIIVAIVIVVVVGAANDWQKERQFVKLNKKKEDRTIKVVRSGTTREISVYDIFVGDVVNLEPGDMIPVDGILIQGHGIKCDESSATGESDLLKKMSGEEAFKAIERHDNLKKVDPFILSGAKVSEGVGSFMVTATGVHSSYGKTMMSLREDSEVTPLQNKLNVLATYIAKLGGAAALLLFVVLFIEFLVRLKGSPDTPAETRGRSLPPAALHRCYHRYRRSSTGGSSPGCNPSFSFRHNSYVERQQPGPSSPILRNHGKCNHHLLRQDRYIDTEQNDGCRWLSRHCSSLRGPQAQSGSTTT